MKVLFLSQGKIVEDHPGWNDALEKLKNEKEIEDYLNIPYLGYAEKFGWETFYNNVVNLAKINKYDVVYFQYFHKKNKPSPRNCIEKLKSLDNEPIILTSAGDPFSDNWMIPDYPEDFKEASRLSDITFSTQMGKAAEKMKKWGARNIVLAPNSMCQVRFKAQEVNPISHRFDFDVVMVASKNTSRNPFSKYWVARREREKMVNSLYKKFGKRFGLFGKGWEVNRSQGPVKFNDQQSAFRRGRIIVGGNPYSYSDYYSSNRLFFEISSGIPTVELSVPRLNNILKDGEHCYFVDNVEHLIYKCEELLNTDIGKLYNRSKKSAIYIQNNHTQYHRLKYKLSISNHYKKNRNLKDIQFPFFLDNVNIENERNYALKI